jgi:hypothetical protein
VSALADLPRAPADAHETLAQIGPRTIARLGGRDFVRDDNRGELRFRVGPDQPHRKVIVVLRADDTYAVEVGRLDRIDLVPTFISEATEGTGAGLGEGIYGDQLAETIGALLMLAINGPDGE